MVTMLYPLRPKTGDHAYFGYQRPGLFTISIEKYKDIQILIFWEMVSM